tara:strand:+ start:5138 stop:5821 length:684 start_codon:yes stop_codon:yes gene_type:complete
MPSEVGRALGRGKKKGLTHKEVMHKRHLKRKKKEKKNNKDRKIKLLQEYHELNKVKYSSKKDTSMAIMELVEDVKEKIPSGVYLDIMNQLMALNKEKETLSPIPRNTTVHGSEQFEDDSDDDYIMEYFRNLYYVDRVGNRGYIYNEVNNINENTIIIDRPHNTLTTINYPIEPPVNNMTEQSNVIVQNTRNINTPIRGNWRRTGQGSWVPREGIVAHGSGNMDDYSF